MAGLATAVAVRRLPAAQPALAYTHGAWGIPREIRELLRRDRELWWAIVVVAIFWMVGGMVQQAVNALGKTQLGRDEWDTSLLVVAIGVGISIGCALGGYLSRGRVNPRIVAVGTTGLVVTLAIMAVRGGPQQHWLGYEYSFPVLVAMGVFTGMFVVPVQVSIQSRAPRQDKGRVIATMNQFSWIGIIFGAAIYQACIAVLDATGWPRNTIFGVTAVLLLPVAIFYRPEDRALAEC
jgi:acyl-[acyl-carrier-protein]-phospholipid O-acyltransferase/long-chain-fatty-acid--[acyl-carrier-protein] ligase